MTYLQEQLSQSIVARQWRSDTAHRDGQNGHCCLILAASVSLDQGMDNLIVCVSRCCWIGRIRWALHCATVPKAAEFSHNNRQRARGVLDENEGREIFFHYDYERTWIGLSFWLIRVGGGISALCARCVHAYGVPCHAMPCHAMSLVVTRLWQSLTILSLGAVL